MRIDFKIYTYVYNSSDFGDLLLAVNAEGINTGELLMAAEWKKEEEKEKKTVAKGSHHMLCMREILVYSSAP